MSVSLQDRAAEAIRVPMAEIIEPARRTQMARQLVYFAVQVYSAAAGPDECSLYLASLSGQASRAATQLSRRRSGR